MYPSPRRHLLLRILDVLVEWQMRQSLRAICRGHEACAELPSGTPPRA